MTKILKNLKLKGSFSPFFVIFVKHFNDLQINNKLYL